MDKPGQSDERTSARVMFLYWGRRGALTPFTLEVGRAAFQNPGVSATISVSNQNENYEAFQEFGPALFPVDTFPGPLGALTHAWRIPALRRALAQRLAADRIQAVIELMPHVWSPLVAPVIRNAGVRYVTVVHDADPHPGDHTSFVKGFSDRALPMADRVFTLSSAVAEQLAGSGRVPAEKLVTLFHPDLHFGPPAEHRALAPGQPMRLLFFGRIMDYKGLPLFLDAVDVLRQAGRKVTVGVFGEGNLGACLPRLAAMDAEIVNRWLSGAEIAAAFSRYDAMVAAHIEASQSGTVAAALGAGLPVVATPVGGLVEQIDNGVTGVIAARAQPRELAAAIEKLLLDQKLYEAVCLNIASQSGERSMRRFVDQCIAGALKDAAPMQEKTQ